MHAVASDGSTAPVQVPDHLPAVVPRRLEELLVDDQHQREVNGMLGDRLVVERRAAHRHEPTLPRDRETMSGLDHLQPSIQAHRPKAFDAKNVLDCQLPHLRVQLLEHIHAGRLCGFHVSEDDLACPLNLVVSRLVV